MDASSKVRILVADDHPLIQAGRSAFLVTEVGKSSPRRATAKRPSSDTVSSAPTYHGDENIHRALAAGARGYLLKDMPVGGMTEVIRAVSQGRKGVPRAVTARLAEYVPRVPLTP